MSDPVVYLVDDDASIRDAVKVFLELNGIHTQPFASGDEFLEQLQADWIGCVLLDLKMPGRDGLEVQQELIRRGSPLPVVIMTAHGDVATVRTSLKAGAFDFLEKPVDHAVLLEVVQNVFDLDRRRRRDQAERGEVMDKIARLTPREQQVMRHLALGHPHREIAEALGISPRTVEVYKARMMEKLGTRSLADVIHLASRLREESQRNPP